MGIRRLFSRKKKKEEEQPEEDIDAVEESLEVEDDTIEATEEAVPEPVAEEEEAAPESTEEPYDQEPEYKTLEPETGPAAIGGTIPYHSTLQDRLVYMLSDSEISGNIEAPDFFCIEFMAMGERFHVEKPSMGDVGVRSGAGKDTDAFVRIANDVVSDLLSAANFTEFSTIFMKYYKNPEPNRYVKIELRKDITDLNRRGYARVPVLKLLIGAVR